MLCDLFHCEPFEVLFLQNLSIVLRKLATALKVSVTELIDPDFAGTIASQVVQVLHTAATPGGARDVETLSTTDRRRIWTRVMRKALKEMERD